MAASVFELPELTVLPDWLHPELLEDLSLVALVSIALVALLAFRLIRRLALRGVVVGLLVVLAVGLWEQRAQLSDCVDPVHLHSVRPDGPDPRRQEPPLPGVLAKSPVTIS